jgi:hypothetical protein
MLFRTHRVQVNREFRYIADEVGRRVLGVVMEQGALVEVNLDTLRDEHRVLECDRDHRLRHRVEEEVERARFQMERVCRAVEEVVGESRDVTMSG